MSINKFSKLVEKYRIDTDVANHLETVLTNCKVVLLCDDSASMSTYIFKRYNGRTTHDNLTRWIELKELTSKIIELVSALNPFGLDIYFLNRGKFHNVIDASVLDHVFDDKPRGETPLISRIKSAYHDNLHLVGTEQELLFVVITDGVPTDGSKSDLYSTLLEITKHKNIHISFADCTDAEKDMESLNDWDYKIPNFDNTDDFIKELEKVKKIHGNEFKFDYEDYVIKIMLATFIKRYFDIDQPLSTVSLVDSPSVDKNTCSKCHCSIL